VDLHIAGLADAEGAVGGLVFHGGVPPAVEVENVVGAGEVEAHTPSLEGEDKQARGGGVILEAVYHGRALGLAGAAVEEQRFVAQVGGEVALEQLAPLGKLGEDQGAISGGDQFFHHFIQPLQLHRATLEAQARFLQKQGGVVADLLQPGE